MEVLIDLPDNQACFGVQVLKSLSFVRKAKPFSKSGSKIYDDLQEAAGQVWLHKQDKIKLKTAQKLLNE